MERVYLIVFQIYLYVGEGYIRFLLNSQKLCFVGSYYVGVFVDFDKLLEILLTVFVKPNFQMLVRMAIWIWVKLLGWFLCVSHLGLKVKDYIL